MQIRETVCHEVLGKGVYSLSEYITSIFLAQDTRLGQILPHWRNTMLLNICIEFMRYNQLTGKPQSFQNIIH